MTHHPFLPQTQSQEWQVAGALGESRRARRAGTAECPGRDSEGRRVGAAPRERDAGRTGVGEGAPPGAGPQEAAGRAQREDRARSPRGRSGGRVAGPRPAYLEVMGFPQPGPRADTPRFSGSLHAVLRREVDRSIVSLNPNVVIPARVPSARTRPAPGARTPGPRCSEGGGRRRAAEAGSARRTPPPRPAVAVVKARARGSAIKGGSSLASADTNPPAPPCLKGRRGRGRGAAEAGASSAGVRTAWAPWSAHFAVTGLRLHARSPSVRAPVSISSQDLCERVAQKFCGCLELLPRRPTNRSSPGKGGALEMRPPKRMRRKEAFEEMGMGHAQRPGFDSHHHRNWTYPELQKWREFQSRDCMNLRRDFELWTSEHY
eukprot:XP_017455027.1 PREDICTED: uncharacterized protein LOC103693711 isoform X1 [Rattus norvegicus]